MKISEMINRKVSRSNSIVIKEAYKRGVEFESLPKKRFKMTYKNKSYLIRKGSIFWTYNTRLANRVTDMKEVTSRLLRTKGYPAPENTVFSMNDVERAWKWAEPILPIVLKPYNGTMGKLVFVNIDNYEEFKSCFEKISEKHNEVLIEKFQPGKEYRFTFVKNEIVGIAHRIPANVTGDGVKTVKQLIKEKNQERKLRKNPIHKQIKLDEESERVLHRKGYSFSYVPVKNEVIYLRENSNVSTGGDAIDVTNEISDEIKEHVKKAMLSINGLRVCGIDVLINDDKINILEINTKPMLTIHHYPWKGSVHNVAGKVVDAMFPETIKNESK